MIKRTNEPGSDTDMSGQLLTKIGFQNTRPWRSTRRMAPHVAQKGGPERKSISELDARSLRGGKIIALSLPPLRLRCQDGK